MTTESDTVETWNVYGAHRLARRLELPELLVAVGRSLLVVIWHLLSTPDTRFHDPGSDYYDTRIDPDRRKRNHIRQLEALGFTVTLAPAA
ncbi:hypothetical protein ACLB9X_33025 [Streptomyces sp. 5K101]|uniref:hypothetical protein n=1 Tax=Streptomyces sp. 5K101 TaxID=3390037 RepID=UPI00397513F1